MLMLPDNLTHVALVFAAETGLPLASLAAQDADLIVRNARIWTGDSTRPRAQNDCNRGARRSPHDPNTIPRRILRDERNRQAA